MVWNPGQQLFGGRYIIERKLGEGGIGITYLAKNQRGELRVIKTLREQILNHPAWISKQDKLRQNFRDEALRLALCGHPHIVQVENVFDEDNLPCMAMEYIEGEDLGKQITEKGALPEAEALQYIKQIGDALAVVHEKGLLHRDLKPSNIMMRAGKPEAVLIDFGIARQFIPGGVQQHTQNLTPGYAPPEQYIPDAERGEYIDVYALAATLYALLTGQLPMPAPARLQNFTLRSPKDLNSSVSDQVNEAIMKGMALNYKFRPQSVQQWLDLLGRNVATISAIKPQTQSYQSTQNTSNFVSQVSQNWRHINITNYAHSVNQVAFSPDGHILATGHRSSFKLWNLASDQQIQSFDLSDNYTDSSLAFSRNGETLIIACSRGFSVWDIASNREIRTIRFDLDENNFALDVAFSGDRQMVAASLYDREEVQLWEVSTGKKIRTIITGDRSRSILFSPDGKILATALNGNNGKLWEVSTGKEIFTFPGSKATECLAFSPDGQILAGAPTYGGSISPYKSFIKLWDVVTGKKICSTKAAGRLSELIESLEFSPNGQLLASGHWNGNVKLWQLSRNWQQQITLKHIWTYTSGSEEKVESVKFSPDGQTLAVSVGYNNSSITLCNVGSGKPTQTLFGRVNGVSSIAISPDGKIIASISTFYHSDTTIKLWNSQDGKLIRCLGNHHNIVAIVFSSDGKTLISSTQSRGEIVLWEVATGKKIQIRSHHFRIDAPLIVFSQYGEIVAGLFKRREDIPITSIKANTDNVIQLQAVRNGMLIGNITTNDKYLTSLAFSPDRQIFASGSSDGSIKLWEVKAGKIIHTIDTYPHQVYSLSFNQTGKVLASGSPDSIKLWQVSSGKEIRTINSGINSMFYDHSESYCGLAFSPDGKILASISSDKTIKLWDVGTGNKISTLTGHCSHIFSIAFSRYGEFLVSAGIDGNIKIWRHSY